MNRVRNGKIARLPFDLREQINRKLRDNTPASRIITWLHQEHAGTLKATGIEKLRRQSFTPWRAGGYKEWECLQERLEEMKIQRELALQIAQQNDGAVQAANVTMAASHIYEALQDYDVRELKKRLQEKPELYSVLIEGVSKLSRAGVSERKLQLELTKYQDRVAEQKRKIEAELGKAKGGGLTAENIAAMEEALNLL